jgi:hypothetical protein
MRCPEQLEGLLRAGEVESALGAPVRPPTCVALGEETEICLWRPATGRRGSLTLTAIAGALAAHTLRVERRLGLPVAGVGDEAYLRAAAPVCVLRRGGRVLKLVLSGSRAPDPAAAVVRLARLAAARLSPQGVLPDHPEQAG